MNLVEVALAHANTQDTCGPDVDWTITLQNSFIYSGRIELISGKIYALHRKHAQLLYFDADTVLYMWPK